MKNRKSLLGLILVVMVLVLGVGYAVVSSIDLSITGNVSTETRDLDVVISSASPTSGSYYGTANNTQSATITVTNMATKGETKTVTYTVSNRESDVDAKVYVETPATDIVVGKPSYFSATTSINGYSNAITVPAGGTATFTVTVTLDTIPVDLADSTSSITVNIKADPVQAS